MKITLYEHSKKVYQTTDAELERIPNIGEFMCIDEIGYNVVDINTDNILKANTEKKEANKKLLASAALLKHYF